MVWRVDDDPHDGVRLDAGRFDVVHIGGVPVGAVPVVCRPADRILTSPRL